MQAAHAGVLRVTGARDRGARASARAGTFPARAGLRLHQTPASGTTALRAARVAHAWRALPAACGPCADRPRASGHAMPLCVLNVAYPLAPVGPDAVGGAEQVLAMIDAALVRAGHES